MVCYAAALNLNNNQWRVSLVVFHPLPFADAFPVTAPERTKIFRDIGDQHPFKCSGIVSGNDTRQRQDTLYTILVRLLFVGGGMVKFRAASPRRLGFDTLAAAQIKPDQSRAARNGSARVSNDEPRRYLA